MPNYKHSQFGTVIVAGLAFGVAVEVVILCLVANAEHPNPAVSWIFATVTIVLALCICLFYKLTVEVTDENLNFWFGAGLIRKRIPLDSIASCTQVRTRLWHGWGIHHYVRGWLYNVSGFHAVEITFKSGKRLRIGTNQPDSLSQVIKKAIVQTQTSTV